MAKGDKGRKRNPTEATMRNVRASKRRDDALAARVGALEAEVRRLRELVVPLEDRVNRLDPVEAFEQDKRATARRELGDPTEG